MSNTDKEEGNVFSLALCINNGSYMATFVEAIVLVRIMFLYISRCPLHIDIIIHTHYLSVVNTCKSVLQLYTTNFTALQLTCTVALMFLVSALGGVSLWSELHSPIAAFCDQQSMCERPYCNKYCVAQQC